jgi:hypothetical protein
MEYIRYTFLRTRKRRIDVLDLSSDSKPINCNHIVSVTQKGVSLFQLPANAGQDHSLRINFTFHSKIVKYLLFVYEGG